jgi:Ser/Thr protein kinase RdoA (MazF antagonist)
LRRPATRKISWLKVADTGQRISRLGVRLFLGYAIIAGQSAIYSFGWGEMSTDSGALLPSLGLWPLRRPHVIGPLGGERNLNVLVQDADRARYVLRGCRRNPSRDRIVFQLSFAEHLRQHGVPVPPVIASRAGEYCVRANAGSLWVLSRFADGRHYQGEGPAGLLAAARCLAAVHAAGSSFTARPVDDDTIPDLRRWWTHGQQELNDLHELFAGSGAADELDFLAGWQAALTRDLPLPVLDQLPRTWLHGDFHPRNVVLDGGEVRALLDFDVVHRGCRLEDIAYAASAFAPAAGSGSGSGAGALTCFQRSFSLTGAERQALPHFLVAVHARTAARYRVRQREGTDPVQALRKHVHRMRALRAAIG